MAAHASSDAASSTATATEIVPSASSSSASSACVPLTEEELDEIVGLSLISIT